MCTYVYTYICIYLHIYIYTYMFVDICAYVFMCVLYTFLYVYVYVHTPCDMYTYKCINIVWTCTHVRVLHACAHIPDAFLALWCVFVCTNYTRLRTLQSYVYTYKHIQHHTHTHAHTHITHIKHTHTHTYRQVHPQTHTTHTHASLSLLCARARTRSHIHTHTHAHTCSLSHTHTLPPLKYYRECYSYQLLWQRVVIRHTTTTRTHTHTHQTHAHTGIYTPTHTPHTRNPCDDVYYITTERLEGDWYMLDVCIYNACIYLIYTYMYVGNIFLYIRCMFAWRRVGVEQMLDVYI